MLSAIITLAALGLIAGIGLGIAAKVFAVYIDPRVEQLEAILPAYNCGACGYAGCSDYAKAVVDGQEMNLCAPGGGSVVEKVGGIMGASVEAQEKMVAYVLCSGTDTLAKKKFLYNGVADCNSANLVAGGDKQCSYGCMGLGSCVAACAFESIVIADGIATILPDKCTGCKKCVPACPKDIIKMVPANRAVHVACSSLDKGAVAKKACAVGCIGCKKCAKAVSGDEIVMNDDNTLAIVDYSKPLASQIPFEECPQKTIVVAENEFTDPMEAPTPPAPKEETKEETA
jgi:electron transport complex protein RnfB